MITDEEAERHYDEMLKLFKTTLPHPEREPKRFAAYVKMYRYHLDKPKENLPVDINPSQ